jgi:hypothetical protein
MATAFEIVLIVVFIVAIPILAIATLLMLGELLLPEDFNWSMWKVREYEPM